MSGRQAAGRELALQRLGLGIGRPGARERVGEAIEQLDLALGRQGGVIGHVVAGADEVVEGQDRAPVAGMDQVRGDGEILVPVALAGARRGGGIEGAHAR